MLRKPSALHSLLLGALLLVCTTSCVVGFEREPTPPYVTVRTRPLSSFMGWVQHFGVHSYVLWRESSSSKPRITEVRKWGLSAEHDSRWDHSHRTHSVLTGTDATEAIETMRAVLATGELQERYPENYVIWPGPNSNTFTAEFCREAGVWVDLPPRAVGKDWPTTVPWVLGVHRTTTGLGVQVDVSIVGAQVGLTGVEAHLFGTAIGVSWWPPSIKLPFLPRLGTSALTD